MKKLYTIELHTRYINTKDFNGYHKAMNIGNADTIQMLFCSESQEETLDIFKTLDSRVELSKAIKRKYHVIEYYMIAYEFNGFNADVNFYENIPVTANYLFCSNLEESEQRLFELKAYNDYKGFSDAVTIRFHKNTVPTWEELETLALKYSKENFVCYELSQENELLQVHYA